MRHSAAKNPSRRAAVGRAFLLAAAFLAIAPPLAAQSIRLHTTTTAQLVQMRPYVQDTAGNYVASDMSTALPVSEDIELSAWDLGLTGLRAYGLFRLRGSLGSGLVWPVYSDHFDALAAYFELERTTWRLRVGRQQRASGLGLYGFDGGAATWRPEPNIRLEAYGGRALARGFNDPINSDAIISQDPLIPDKGTLLIGFSGWMAPTARSSIAAVYQREVFNDFSGVVSERVALDGQTAIAKRWTLSGSGDYDLAAHALGKARLGLTARLPEGASVALAVFRYRPTFDLNTIWGVFAPQASHGGSVSATAPAIGAVSLSAGWTLRVYDPATETTPFLTNVGTTANTWTLGADWNRGPLNVSGSYHYITGYGGAESGGDLRGQWNRSERLQLALNATAFQNTEYFRVEHGTVIGAGADARARVTDRLAISGQLMQYGHIGTSGAAQPDWSQLRAVLQVDWTFGASADRIAYR